jgi:hypothetical protein
VARTDAASTSIVQRARSEAASAGDVRSVANGELLFRTKDYDRAIVVVQRDHRGFPTRRATRTRSGCAARRTTRRTSTSRRAATTAHARRSGAASLAFQPYFGRALARLVDVSLRGRTIRRGSTRSSRSLNQVPPAQVDAGSLRQGQGLLRQEATTNDAQRRSQSVANGTAYTHQARYFQGLIAMKQARAATCRSGTPASAGHRVLQRPTTSRRSRRSASSRSCRRHRRAQARDRSRVDGDRAPLLRDGAVPAGERGVREGGARLARVRHDALRARVGVRAPRATCSAPSARSRSSGRRSDSSTSGTARSSAPTSCSARARSTRRSSSTRGAHAVRSDAREGGGFLDSTKDVGVYYEKLRAAARCARRQNDQLPPLAVRWAREAEDGPAGVRRHRRREPVQDAHPQSEQLIEKLNALMGAANRVRAFPELARRRDRGARPHQPSLARARRARARGSTARSRATWAARSGRSGSSAAQLMGVVGRAVTQAGLRRARPQGDARSGTVVSQELSRRSASRSTR